MEKGGTRIYYAIMHVQRDGRLCAHIIVIVIIGVAVITSVTRVFVYFRLRSYRRNLC